MQRRRCRCVGRPSSARSYRSAELDLGSLGIVADIKDLEPLIGRWSQVVEAPRHVAESVRGEMTLEWLRDEKVILQRSMMSFPLCW